MSPLLHLVRSGSKTEVRFSISTPESDFHWHLPILTSQCNHLHILLGRQIPTVSLLSSFSATTTYEMLTRWKESMQSFVSVPIRLARKELKQRQKTVVRSRYLRWTPISTDTILLYNCNIDQSIFCATERPPELNVSLRECSPPPSLTSVHHWKMQTISMCHC